MNLKQTLLRAIPALLVFAVGSTARAQWGVFDTHYHVVPHTTTHNDYVAHGNHFDRVPHTQTHFDVVPHLTYRPQYQRHYRPRYRLQFEVPHTTTHTDYYRHNNHSHGVPHTTTHFHPW